MLLDCCAASGSIRSPGQGMVQVLAASDFENTTPLAGPETFTAQLVSELSSALLRSPPRSIPVIELHGRLINRMKRRVLDDSSRRWISPQHFFIAQRRTWRSIALGPWKPVPVRPVQEVLANSSNPLLVQSSTDSASSSQSGGDSNMSSCATSISEFSELWPDITFQNDKVLLAINLSRTISPNLVRQDWEEWLRQIPTAVDYMNIEAIYRSQSTLLIVSMSVAAWDLLPDHPATSFIGFISSSNLKEDILPTTMQENETEDAKTDQKQTEWSALSEEASKADFQPVSGISQAVRDKQSLVDANLENFAKVKQTTQALHAEPLVLVGSAHGLTSLDLPASTVLSRELQPESMSEPIHASDPKTFKETFRFQELQSADEVRILKIVNGEYNEPIRCIHVHRNLSKIGKDGDGKDGDYRALSYCWDYGEERTEIEIVGIESDTHNLDSSKKGFMIIRPNVAEALRQLRSTSEDINIWIDALCVNMDDLNERSHCISISFEIYRYASQICIWLGPGSERTPESFAQLRYMLSMDLTNRAEENYILNVISNFHQIMDGVYTEWFTRRWVIQEVAMAKVRSLLKEKTPNPTTFHLSLRLTNPTTYLVN
jgi:hypothetical protein